MPIKRSINYFIRECFEESDTPGSVRAYPFLKNQKEAYFRLEGRIFGGVSVRVDMTMQVIDGYNSADILVDAIRVAKIAKDRKYAGVISSASSFFCKNPVELLDDATAKNDLMAFVQNAR